MQLNYPTKRHASLLKIHEAVDSHQTLEALGSEYGLALLTRGPSEKIGYRKIHFGNMFLT